MKERTFSFSFQEHVRNLEFLDISINSLFVLRNSDFLSVAVLLKEVQLSSDNYFSCNKL